MSIRVARAQAERLIELIGVKKPSVDVEAIAKRLNLKIIYANLGEKVSGLLVSDGKTAHICVQEDHPRSRQRFTIGHEIGHYFLKHQFKEGGHVHVDRGNYISERSARASEGIDLIEIEANQFAACLLMPSKMLSERVQEYGEPLLDYEVTELAEEFEVSEQAMTIRLSSLGLL